MTNLQQINGADTAGEVNTFDYGQLDGEAAAFLETKESNIRGIVRNAHTDVGRELTEAQAELAGNNQYNGKFEQWYTSLGYKKRSVYELIDHYSLVVRNPHERDLLETLPISLTKAAGKASAPPEAVDAVLSGDISTHAGYQAFVKKLKAEEAGKLDAAKEIISKLTIDNSQITQDKIAADKATARAEELAEEFESKLNAQVDTSEPVVEDTRPYGVKLGDQMYKAFDDLSEWQKDNAWILTDRDEFGILAEVNPDFARQFQRLDKFWNQISNVFHSVELKGVYNTERVEPVVIDAEFTYTTEDQTTIFDVPEESPSPIAAPLSPDESEFLEALTILVAGGKPVDSYEIAELSGVGLRSVQSYRTSLVDEYESIGIRCEKVGRGYLYQRDGAKV